MPEYVVIATWPFGKVAVEAAAELLRQGKPALDAVVAGAQAVEDDPQVRSVGWGSLPNAVGTVQLDASVMDGRTLACGAVAGVENVRHPAALARRVMEETPHILLVGEGARWFALKQGFPLENLQSPAALAEWEERRRRLGREGRPGQTSATDQTFDHDTVTVLALDRGGSLAGACSTSGLGNKLPGRVGDSPVIGAGLYVDNAAGAAGGTGIGEENLRIGGGLVIVEAMRGGLGVQEACERAVRRVNDVAVRRGLRPAKLAFLALDPRGRVGAASTATTGFDYAVARPGKIELLRAPEIAVD
jgi:isoaspartyl peptidase/L-asparaginase-like protein (Ntn-hydrolase superfamily)